MSTTRRAKIVHSFFPDGVPNLWCPLLTHYDEHGRIDAERMRAHLARLAPTVRAVLAPGSTGDGWEMTSEERSELLDILLDAAERYDVWVLVGVLETERGAARKSIQETAPALADRRVCGFTVTPPAGSDLSQEEIRSELEGILGLGRPTALYQLPQVTENEISPQTVSALAQSYPNFYLFKDTSDADRVAHSEEDLFDVFLVRGAEGDYHHHLKAAGGRYDGFLLSTANCFAEELRRITELVEAGAAEEARALSERVQATVKPVFDTVSDLPFGNPFANANKAIDHVKAYHPRSTDIPPPMTHSGNRLPEGAVRRAQEALEAHKLLPERGYLEA
jgi:dihydrodipicolinate synthase/N-acetylneuraminate lyase